MGREGMIAMAALVRRGGIALAALLAMVMPAAALARPAAADVLTLTRKVADWQLTNGARRDLMPGSRDAVLQPRDWQQATFWVALTDLADRDPAYRTPLLALGRQEGWRLYRRPFHADDQLIGQAWIWAARNGAGQQALAPTTRYFEHVLANRPTTVLDFIGSERQRDGTVACTVRWCWCDALFMAPPTLLQLSAATGDRRYAKFVHEEFQATKDFLYDAEERLFYRDSRFIDRRDAAGRKVFWSRGNGWVLAGLARMIDALPTDDPARAGYVDLFRDMSARIVALQKPDGSWPPSLLDDGPSPPESSGTGFFTYAFAWGIRNGVLDRPTYEPAALRGWASIAGAVTPDGMVGWVQQVGDRPGAARAEHTQFYGTGAFILAGVAIHDLLISGD